MVRVTRYDVMTGLPCVTAAYLAALAFSLAQQPASFCRDVAFAGKRNRRKRASARGPREISRDAPPPFKDHGPIARVLASRKFLHVTATKHLTDI